MFVVGHHLDFATFSPRLSRSILSYTVSLKIFVAATFDFTTFFTQASKGRTFYSLPVFAWISLLFARHKRSSF